MSELLLSPRKYFEEKVEEGFAKRNLKTYPAVRSYVVDLLQHYLDAKNLFDDEINEAGQKSPSTLAEMYLRASNAQNHERIDLLKKLGDKSLYISGFFGDSLQRKIVDIDYYAEMGGAAFSSLSSAVREDHQSAIYRTISDRFLDLVDVLTYISQKSLVQNDQGLLRLYDRYLRTGSELAREQLIEMGVVTVSKDHIKLVRQD